MKDDLNSSFLNINDTKEKRNNNDIDDNDDNRYYKKFSKKDKNKKLEEFVKFKPKNSLGQNNEPSLKGAENKVKSILSSFLRTMKNEEKVDKFNKKNPNIKILISKLSNKKIKLNSKFYNPSNKQINSFMNSNSQVYASWHEHENESVINQVLNDEISFGLVIGKPIASNNLEIALVKSIELVIYVYKDHKFWNRDSIEIKDLRDEHIISMNENYHIYHDLINACYLNDFTPDIVGKVGEGESIYLLVANQVGVGIAPRFFSDNDRIKAIRIKDSYTWDVYGIYRNDSADKDLAKEFLDII